MERAAGSGERTGSGAGAGSGAGSAAAAADWLVELVVSLEYLHQTDREPLFRKTHLKYSFLRPQQQNHLHLLRTIDSQTILSAGNYSVDQIL